MISHVILPAGVSSWMFSGCEVSLSNTESCARSQPLGRFVSGEVKRDIYIYREKLELISYQDMDGW